MVEQATHNCLVLGSIPSGPIFLPIEVAEPLTRQQILQLFLDRNPQYAAIHDTGRYLQLVCIDSARRRHIVDVLQTCEEDERLNLKNLMIATALAKQLNPPLVATG